MWRRDRARVMVQDFYKTISDRREASCVVSVHIVIFLQTAMSILSFSDSQCFWLLQGSSTVTRAIEFYGPDRGTFLVRLGFSVST